MSAFVQTHSGKPFFPLEPSPYLVDIEDIAHSLSMQCRYNGHVRRFYSVAEHCVALSYTVDREHARWALLHDAAEAYIGDMVWPLKEQIPEFKRVEAGIMAAICERFGMDPVQPEQVTEHDRRIVIDERDQLMAPGYRPWPALVGFAPLRVKLEGWGPTRASSEYLSRFQQLFTEI